LLLFFFLTFYFHFLNVSLHHIVIIGTGTAGSAAALLLEKQGYKVSVFEKVSEPGTVGAGILLQTTGQMVLKHLGLYEAALNCGSKINELYGEDLKGKKVLSLKYKDLDPAFFGLGIHRGSLFSLLINQVRKTNIKLYCGIEITEIIPQGENLYLLKDIKGEVYGPFTMVIVADGAKSNLSISHSKITKHSKYNWGALWTCVPFDNNAHADVLFQVYEGTKRMIGMLPSGRFPDQNKDNHLISIFWGIHLDKVKSWQDNKIEKWKEEVLKFLPSSEKSLAHIHDHSQFAIASYNDVRMYPWNEGGVLYIGDSAHAMSPHLGQGANFALTDALILSECMKEADSINEALKLYNEIRKSHINYYQRISHYIFPFFQSSNNYLSLIRDPMFRLMCSNKITKKIMLQTFVGIRKGFLWQN
jgi:2-polyprenyl-6-methoxyphenol hydroxylase-like FAD-dependent oxidoreductase